MFTVGQKVWCVIFGEGVVAEINHDLYPIKVKFKNGEVETYKSGGYMFSNCINQSLFHHPVKIVQDESATKPSIDWSHDSEKYQYLAMDADGLHQLFAEPPKRTSCTWHTWEHCVYAGCFASFIPGTCDWKDSLVKRPE